MDSPGTLARSTQTNELLPKKFFILTQPERTDFLSEEKIFYTCLKKNQRKHFL